MIIFLQFHASQKNMKEIACSVNLAAAHSVVNQALEPKTQKYSVKVFKKYSFQIFCFREIFLKLLFQLLNRNKLSNRIFSSQKKTLQRYFVHLAGFQLVFGRKK